MTSCEMIRYTVGVDIGGTFTDIVCAGSDGSLRLMKRPTTRGDPAAAVRGAVDAMRADWGIDPASIERRFVRARPLLTKKASSVRTVADPAGRPRLVGPAAAPWRRPRSVSKSKRCLTMAIQGPL